MNTSAVAMVTSDTDLITLSISDSLLVILILHALFEQERKFCFADFVRVVWEPVITPEVFINCLVDSLGISHLEPP